LYIPFLSVYMMSYILTLQLGVFAAKQEVSFFAISRSLGTLSFLLFIPVSKILMPTVSRIYKLDDHNKLQVLGKVLAKYVGMAAIFIASVFCFGSTLILKYIYGDAYMNAAPILVILSLGIFFETFKFVTDSLLNGTKYASTVSQIEIYRLIGIIIAGFFLIQRYGAMGAAVAFLASSIFGYVSKVYMVKRKLAIDLSKEAGKVFLLSILLSIFLWFGWNFVIFLFVAVFCVVLLRLLVMEEIKIIYSLSRSRF